jgi:predicted dehydrogenase
VSVPVRLGLLSTARINDAILAAAAEVDEVEVVAVASREANRANAYAHEHGIPTAHGSYDDLLVDSAVDAVYVSLPNSLHFEWAMRSLSARKHVLCEKPFTRWPGQAEEAFELARHSGLVLTEGFMYRHHPQAAKVKELVDQGAVGQVQLVRSSFSFVLQDTSDVRARPELDGGSLMDLGCYCVSFSRYLVGEPARVTGEQIMGRTGVDVSFHGTMRTPGDVVAQFDCSLARPRYQRLDVVGDEAFLLVDTPWRATGEGELLLRHGEHLSRIEVPEADGYVRELENFAKAVAGSEPPGLSAPDSIGQARVIDALYRSATEGRAIDL